MSWTARHASGDAVDSTPQAATEHRMQATRTRDVIDRPHEQLLFAAVTIAIACYFTAKLGVALAPAGVPAPELWGPNAILLAALILTARGQWWIFLAAALPAHILAQIALPDVSLVQSAIQYASVCCTALIGAFSMTALAPGAKRFDSVRPTAVLIFLCGLPASLAGSILMAAVLLSLGLDHLFWLPVITQALTTTFAIITIVPLIAHAVAWTRMAHHALRPLRAIEICLFALSLCAVGLAAVLAPVNEGSESILLYFAPAPLLIWAIARLGIPGICSAALLLGAAAVTISSNSGDPLAAVSPEANFLALVGVLVLLGTVLLILTASLEERSALHKSAHVAEARIRAILSFKGLAIVMWGSDGRIVDANESFLHLSGFGRADIVAGRLRFDELTSSHPGHGQDNQDPSEAQLVRRDGARVPVFINQYPLEHSVGAGAACFLDLSQARRSESARRNERLMHSAVLASVHDQIVVIDRNGVVIEANDSWRRSRSRGTTHPFEHAQIGEHYLQVCANAAGDGDAISGELLEEIRAVLAGSSARRLLEFSIDSPDGLVWFEMSVEPLRRADGGAVIARTDITERKLAMAQAREQHQQLTHLGRAAVLGELSGAFAHELTQPLTSILGNAEAALQLLTRDSPDVAEIREMLQDIVQADIRAAEVIQRLRAMLTRGEIQRQPVALDQIVREVLELARSDLVTRNVSVSTQFDSRALPVLADRVQLQQVMLNLVVNACESMSGVATGERKLMITIQHLADRGVVECAVADRGCGIAPDDLERIFQPFVTTKQQGLGLGLAICRSIVEAHGGKLWAENAAGGGAVFRFITRVDT